MAAIGMTQIPVPLGAPITANGFGSATNKAGLAPVKARPPAGLRLIVSAEHLLVAISYQMQPFAGLLAARLLLRGNTRPVCSFILSGRLLCFCVFFRHQLQFAYSFHAEQDGAQSGVQ